MRKKIVCGNWKMNTSKENAVKLVADIESNLAKIDFKNLETIICPPFVYLEVLKSDVKKLQLGAQNCYFEKEGPFTGEISAFQLTDFCSHIILGHSERRIFLKETDKEISPKIIIALEAGLKPIVCVGETKEEREKGEQSEVIKRQVLSAIKGLSSDDLSKLIFVYEPVWAISTFGSGEVCNVSLTLPAVSLIREVIKEQFEESVLDNIPILYGGSVASNNVDEFVKEDKIDGVLVGAKSLDAEDFSEIIKIYNEAS